MSGPSDMIVVADSWFDGERFHGERTSFLIEDGAVSDLRPGDASDEARSGEIELVHVPFLMPGLVDAHVHLFLDGAPTDLAERSAHMKKSVEELTEAARASARQTLAHGVSLVREAGDKYGINQRIRAEAIASPSLYPQVHSGGIGIRKPKRYGAFMARDVTDDETIRATTAELAEAYDEVKLILTGIIDFEKGAVLDEPQFTLEEVKLVVDVARRHGKAVFAHCSGLKGLQIAAAAGIGSIEHGFFMSDDVLATMLANDVAWCPTFCPVHAQWANPTPMKWSEETLGHLRRILDDHARHLLGAHEMGVTLLVGTDAGSMGVEHGKAMLTEMRLFLEAGVPLEAVLRAATSGARRRFGLEPRVLARGAAFDAFAYPADPRRGMDHLAAPVAGFIAGERVVVAGA